ncbi:MAG: glycine--tRNA ligase subunit beta [Alphaproteobacteria bacterium]|nr:glycine--tRNA ligase subunit beta [Alphaproteobacteria bacterium]
MAELFVELFGEEIPARMQVAAEARLTEALTKTVKDAGLGGGNAKSWSGPRRLAVALPDVEMMQPDLNEERRGPRADAPEQAIAGFLKGAGITLDQAERRDTPKGEFLFAVINKKGAAAADVLPPMIAEVLANFTWPKSMRWGRSRSRWVRPLHRVSVLFDGQPLSGSLDLGGGQVIEFGGATLGHRMISPAEIELSSGKLYDAQLAEHAVIADRAARVEMITGKMAELTSAEGREVRDDQGLMAEVAGLVEFPHPVMGAIDDNFMALPPEILVVSMRSHQKYFAVSEKDGGLAPRFITIANMTPDAERDALIRVGNERVLRARLADARFFWDQDRAAPLADNTSRLSGITFFEGLGTMGDKAARLETLAGQIASLIGADAAAAKQAGLLAKADLVSETVGEFPELQGIIGGYLARDAHGDAVADAIAGHYRPEGPGDDVPQAPVTVAVALADKIDTLVGFFGVGAVPTGSKDPFALRRAALGVLRIVVENNLTLNLADVLAAAAATHGFDGVAETLPPFIQDRFKVWLRDQGIGHDIVASLIRADDPRWGELTHITRLAGAMAELLATDDGAGLMAGYKRASNILAAEEKKDGARYDGAVDAALISVPAEQALFDRVTAEQSARQDDTDAMITQLRQLGGMRAPIDTFFDDTTVNDDDPAIRLNRLNLLGQIRALMNSFADFSAIEG